MITGSFTTSLGDVTVSINAGNGTCKILSIGTINYNFDITPDQVTIDRVQALYQTINISLFQYDDVGVDLYETITAQAELGNVRVDLSILTHDLETFEFPFMVGVNDVTINEQTREVMLKCQQFINNAVRNLDVFSSLSAQDLYPFKKRDSKGVQRSYTCAMPETFAIKAMKMCFGNEFDTVFESGNTNLTGSYSAKVFSGNPSEPDFRLPGTTQFVLVNMTGNDFRSVDQDLASVLIGRGNISYGGEISVTDFQGDTETVLSPFVQGIGTFFLTDVAIGDILYARIGGDSLGGGAVPIYLGVVKSVIDETNLELESWPPTQMPDGLSFVPFQVHPVLTPEKIPALNTVKDLAGAEGAIFGTGFSKNFYVNRLLPKDRVTIPYNAVTELKASPFYFSLGTSVLRQSASVRRDGAKQLGRYESRGIIGLSPSDFRNLPNLEDTSSVSRPGPNAVKELKIEFAPAYPILNKAQYANRGGGGSTLFFNGDYDGTSSDNTLEQALTRVGLTSYIRALTSKGNDIVVEFTCTGAFRLKPYETFVFTTDAPEAFVGKEFRPTELHYDIVNDTVKCKAYQVGLTNDEVQSSDGFPTFLGAIANELDYGVVTSLGGTVVKTMRAIGQSLINPVVITSSDVNFLISPTGESYAQSIELSPDGQGNVQQEVSVIFAPRSSGSFVSDIVFSTFITPTTAITRSFTVFGTAYSGFKPGDWGVVLQAYDAEVTSLSVNLFSALKAGSEIEIINPVTNTVYVVTVTADTPAGVQNLPIEAQVLDIPENAYVRGSQAYQGTGIFVSENQIVLKVNSNGDIAQIALGTDNVIGSVIDISADQVKINDIVFVKDPDPLNPGDPGLIRSANYVSGTTGWKIDGYGGAEFSNVVVRGEVIANTGTLGNLNVDGTLTIGATGEITNSGSNYEITDTGITLFGTGDVRAEMSGDSFSVGTVSGGSIATIDPFALNIGLSAFPGNRIEISSDLIRFYNAAGIRGEIGGFVNFSDNSESTSTITGSIITAGGVGIAKRLNVGGAIGALSNVDSTSKDTGSIITEGGIGIEKNAYIGGNIGVIGTANLPSVTITNPTTTTYNVTATDTHISIDSSITDTINLPVGTAGRKITMFQNNAITVTINRASTDLINGNTSTTITNAYQAVTFIFNAGNWYII